MVSKVITLAIITALTLIIGISFTSYITSVITPLFEKYPEEFQIKGDSYISKAGDSYIIKLHVFSNIKPLVVVYAIELGGIYIRLNADNTEIENVFKGSISIDNEGLKLTPGTDALIRINMTSVELNLGNFVEIKAYTETGYVYKGMLTFR